MTDVACVVEGSSTTTGKNKAQLTVSASGTRHVHWIERLQFFSEFFKPLPGITAYHHYKVSKKEPGIVTVKEYANSPEEKFNIFKKGDTASLLQGRNLHLSFERSGR